MRLTKFGIIVLILIILSVIAYAGFETVYNPFIMDLDFVRDSNWSDSNISVDCLSINNSKVCSWNKLNDTWIDDGDFLRPNPTYADNLNVSNLIIGANLTSRRNTSGIEFKQEEGIKFWLYNQ